MLEGLAWITATYQAVYCITFAQGLDEPEMLGRFVGDPLRAWQVPDLVEDEELRERLEELEEDGLIVQVGSCEGWAFALEDGRSWEGTRPEILCRISQGTVAVSLYRNVNAFTLFSYAVDGVFVAWLDPLCQQGSPNWDQASGLLSLLQQVGLDPRDHWFKLGKQPLEVMSDLAEALGVRLDREAVAERPLFRTWITRPDGTY